ncbi:TIGR02587 family membrane protein [Prosthecomicrobium pneumaticum]|uniref:Putative integral membrane protein (TIGR02587 family) n=1 Tax=Prosthecomicrobium pneumaticum TaxID=81895 RepID=A0A7W9FMA1_9HYPH|nr:TIGR02587 family membrane protein [Prosthecomicrobium pneumaticum]MBB5753268.1 putative integral membrane protein (TIGR02587 family) [Prosthecomicrobium pneumaticum]
MAASRGRERDGGGVATLRIPSSTEFFVGAGRAFAGALLFSLPMLMTMEFWQLGFTIDPFRLALLLAIGVPLLVRLSRYGGIRHTVRLQDDVADVFVSLLIAFVTAGLLLWLFGEVAPGRPLREVWGKVAVQAFPAAIGAMLALNQFGQGDTDADADADRGEIETRYGGELFLMVVGALFLSLNLAPTDEVAVLAFTMSVWQEIGLLVLTLLLMHAFVHAVEFGGTHRRVAGESVLGLFARSTLAGYAAVFLVSVYVLWTFGRTDGVALHEVISMAIVLSFPGAVGAAFARLIL